MLSEAKHPYHQDNVLTLVGIPRCARNDTSRLGTLTNGQTFCRSFRDFIAYCLLLPAYSFFSSPTHLFQASSCAFLLAGLVSLGSSPVRMKPCPAPS